MSGPEATEVPPQFKEKLDDVIRLEVTADLNHKAMTRIRNRYMRTLHTRHKVSVSAIAKHTGLSRQRVSAIINEKE